ncbi:putative Virulence factor family protein [uncultured Desulfobacterium sp.]|uniref:Putative Virulence factor family protein n=1 Tax=uncultured Desulfobacterium sp. TaxID=201089 RepID=A0A445MX05_9BACT|nr:putative Virulence factor family protein [uncultured Desulfobacterium sp.]
MKSFRNIAYAAFVICAVLLVSCCGCRDVCRISRHDSGEWGPYELWEPAGTVRGLIFFFSDSQGLIPADRDAARELARLGAAVALVPTDVYLSRIDNDTDPDGCLYLPGPVEWTSHYLQEYLAVPEYKRPLLLGRALGAGIVYALLAQGSSQSFAGGMSVDLSSVITIKHPLCSLAPIYRSEKGLALDSNAHLCGWWCAAVTKTPDRDTTDFVKAVSGRNKEVKPEIEGPGTLASLVSRVFAPCLAEKPNGKDATVAGALVEVSGKSTQKALAVIYSGDGGWSDIDRELADYLAAHDIAVVGVNCLSYFWKKRTPDQVGQDLAWLLERYFSNWGMEQAVIVGYSFGADILPPAYNRLPQYLKAKVVQISLLAPSRDADFEFHISGWLDSGPSKESIPLGPEITGIDKGLLQCFYGEEEEADTLCTDPEMKGAETMRTAGSHHFDGNYSALGDKIIEGFYRRAEALKIRGR